MPRTIAQQVDQYLLSGVELDEDISGAPLGLEGEEAGAYYEMKKSIQFGGHTQGEKDKVNPRISCVLPTFGDASTRFLINEATTLEEVATATHKALHCTEVKRKPTLTWKLSTDKKKDPATILDTPEEWVTAMRRARETISRQRKPSEVEIIVGIAESEYLNSLKQRLKPQSQPGASKLKLKSKTKAAPLLLNLDAEDGEDEYLLLEVKEENPLTEREQLYHDLLIKQHSQCQRCGPDVPCKITNLGVHRRLTFQQLDVWALALAGNSTDVTINSPPDMSLFNEFRPHPSRLLSSSCQPSTTPVPMAQPEPSLDPAYTSLSIADFLHTIQQKDPRREVVKYASTFEEKGYLDLSEIFHMNEKMLEMSVSMPEGTARAVRKVMDEYGQK